MPPRSFAVYQPVRSHSFVDFGLSGGLEGLRWSKSSAADPAQFADSTVYRSSHSSSSCSIKQLRVSTFPVQSFAPPSQHDVRAVLAAARKSLRDSVQSTSSYYDTDFAVASLSQKELIHLAYNSTNEWVKEWRTGCNNRSSLSLCQVSGNLHLLWTTGSNGQYLMCTPLDIAGAVADPSSALNASLPAIDCSSIPASKSSTYQRISDVEVIASDPFPHIYVRRRSKLQMYNILETPFSSNSPLLSAVSPCLLSSVELGSDIIASAANYHFPGEAAAVASSVEGGGNKLWIWDIERGEVDSYLHVFDDDSSAFTWAESIWGHHPRSIFCFGPRRMRMVDLRSSAVSTAIDIGSAGVIPSGRFFGAHSPCDPRVPMIFTSCSSAVSSWDLRFLREPVAQILHHLEHDPPSLITSSIRNCSRGNNDFETSNCILMDVLICSSCFSYPLLHSIKIGDESAPATVGLLQSIHGLRQAHQLHHSAKVSHPDGAQCSADTTSGMCLLSNSLPKGIKTAAFFASLSGDIWLSLVSDFGVEVERDFVASANSSDLEFSIKHRAASSFEIEKDVVGTSLRSNLSDDASERLLLPLLEFQKWMAFPRTVDDIHVHMGGGTNGHLSASNLIKLLPSCCLWRLGSSGSWQLISENSSSSSLNAFDILCVTDGSPPVDYLPSFCNQMHVTHDSLASAVNIAFLHRPIAPSALPEPAKLHPILSASKLFGSPLRSSQSQVSQPHVRFMDTKVRTDLSEPQSHAQIDYRITHASSTASATTTLSAVLSKSIFSEARPFAPDLEDLLNPHPNATNSSLSSKRGSSIAARGPKRRASEGF